MYLVDTNVVSEARRGTPEAVAWMRAADAASIHLSVITLGEIRRGWIMKEKSDPRAAAAIRHWLERLRHDHRANILPVSDMIALAWGRTAALRTRGVADGLIAATAMVHGLVLVTRNVGDFVDIDLPVIDPWSSSEDS